MAMGERGKRERQEELWIVTGEIVETSVAPEVKVPAPGVPRLRRRLDHFGEPR